MIGSDVKEILVSGTGLALGLKIALAGMTPAGPDSKSPHLVSF